MRPNVDINDLSQLKRVLIVRLDEIGDVVLTTPFLRELRRNLPDAWITLVVKPAVYNLVELCPYVNEVLTYDWRVGGRFPNLRLHWRALKLAFRNLWKKKFDLAILPRWDADYYHATFLTYFSGASKRVGFSEKVIENKRRRNRDFDRLFTHVLNDNALKHEVNHNLDLIRFLGGTLRNDALESWLSSEDEYFADNFLKSHGIQNDNLLIAFGPFSGSPKRMWPISNFNKLGVWLTKKYNTNIILIGGKDVKPLGVKLQCKFGKAVIDAVGKTTLRQTSALLKRCNLFIGNDAGPMHLAAAVGIPVIEVSCHPKRSSKQHPNSPVRFGPWGVSHYILQPERTQYPCSDACTATQAHCILGITVDQVKDVVKKYLF